MRLSISKPQHRAAIEAVAHQLGSEKAIDGLEHILNCWLVGNVPPSVSTSASASQREQPIDPDDEFSDLIDFRSQQ